LAENGLNLRAFRFDRNGQTWLGARSQNYV
jgi:hypothetical protein